MIKRKRYYDGYGNELRMDEVSTGTVRVSVNDRSIDVPVMELVNMLASEPVKGKHVKQTVLEVR